MVRPKWTDTQPCIVTHKQLAKQISLGTLCPGEDWFWTSWVDYKVTFLQSLCVIGQLSKDKVVWMYALHESRCLKNNPLHCGLQSSE